MSADRGCGFAENNAGNLRKPSLFWIIMEAVAQALGTFIQIGRLHPPHAVRCDRGTGTWPESSS